VSDRPLLVGEDAVVPVVGGGRSRFINLDYAASAPALQEVADAVTEFLPWYSSVHRGSGWKSTVSSEVYEQAREGVGEFVNARSDDVVIFTTNTTGALNLLSEAVPTDVTVVTFDGEHHANLLPWRRRRVVVLPTPPSAAAAVDALDEALSRGSGERLVAVTAASNVTGEIWPVAALCAVARHHGARIVVDTAQLAPHAPVDMGSWEADWVALSGHKLYAPYGGGALIGRRAWLADAAPLMRGGGAVRFVTSDDVAWAGLPDRQEAGSPNVVGVYALGVACAALRKHGMARVLDHEQMLVRYAEQRIAPVPGLHVYRLWEAEAPRIGVLTFNVDGWPHGLLAAALSAEHAVAMRDGCFCAHPLMLRLLQVPDAEAEQLRIALMRGDPVEIPGAVRMSTGLATSTGDIDAAVAAIETLVAEGPRWRYERSPDDIDHFVPVPDDRPLPTLAGLRPGSAPLRPGGAALLAKEMQ
jgi:selenocysteine lyase/cysteine desulfurase